MLTKHRTKPIFPTAGPRASFHSGRTAKMSQPNWWVRLQTEYKELPRYYLPQGMGPNLTTGYFQEQTCKEKENVFKATLLKWKCKRKNSTNILLHLQFSKLSTSNKQLFSSFEKKKKERKRPFCCSSLHTDTYKTSCWETSLWSHWGTTGDHGWERQSSSVEDYWMGTEDFWSCHCHSALQEREKHLHL